jgi:aminopeptidase YwaD
MSHDPRVPAKTIDAAGQAVSHLRALCGTIGPRLIGTPGCDAAADYIESTLQQAGLQTRRQLFACPAWTLQSTTMIIGNENVPVIANTFSRPCDVAAPIVAVGTIAELEAADFHERIALLYGDLVKEPLSTLDNPAYLPPHHRRIAELLIAKRPLAAITVSLFPEHVWPVIEDWAVPIPSVTVPADVGLRLVQSPQTPVQIMIDSKLEPGQSANIIGERAGVAGRIVICAHYDTKSRTPGAIDNASGVAALLTLAQRLAQRDLACGLEFVVFSGEEYGLGGDRYLQDYGLRTIRFGEPHATTHAPHGLDDVMAAINIDGVGQWLGVNFAGTLMCSAAFEVLVDAIRRDYPGMIAIEPGPASNHYDFYTHGVPTLMISSVGMGNTIHHARDTTAWISPQKLAEVIHFGEQLVARVHDRSPAWSRPHES